MKKIYLKPEIKSVSIKLTQLLYTASNMDGSQGKVDEDGGGDIQDENEII
jgi:hypothetical protein